MRNKGQDGTEAFEELPDAFQAELSFETYQKMILQVTQKHILINSTCSCTMYTCTCTVHVHVHMEFTASLKNCKISIQCTAHVYFDLLYM